MACEYPALEVIVVDDCSTDATPMVLQQLQQRYGERLRVVRRTEEPREPNLQGKAGALHLGMEHARGEITLLTDADCVVPPTWVRSMVALFREPSVGFVAGFTLIRGQRLFDRIQSAEWLLLGTAGSGGIGWGQPLGCFGNNLAVRTRAYWDTGGYARIPFSVTEDLSLQQAIHRCGWQMRHLYDPAGVVWTLPVRSPADRLRQLQRWGRGGLQLGLWAVLFVMSSALYWGALLLPGVVGQWGWTAVVAAVRFVADSALGVFSALLLRQTSLVWVLPLAASFLALMELVLPVLVVLRRRIRWKGRLLG
jgi:cellulose synthase/poly-beta-1,6-N-acetylglucosamine synthase-like glycosyltransferase